ncbi:GNAT family N-acetyltransferase [Candidatus Roizmanbacteria bacterium]|nr:GNAT family N-acetyltransferase [Candidatus Roizmanbacteria bacterium]
MSEQEPQPPLKLSTSKELPADQLDGLFNAIGWNSRGAEKWKTVLEKSSYVLSVWDGERVVGMGRILEDGVMCMFYDIGVHPDYQNKGVGKQIMENLIDQVKDKEYASIGLFAWEENPANIPFYEKFGFERQTSGMELVKYMKRE